MKKTIAFLLIIFAFIIGSIIGAGIEAKEIKKSLQIVAVEEGSDFGQVDIEFGRRMLNNGHLSDSEIHRYIYEVMP